MSPNVHVYSAASKPLFGSLVPTAAERSAVHCSFQRVPECMKKMAADAINKTGPKRQVYVTDYVSGVHNSVECLTSADVHAYAAAEKRFLGSLAATTADRSPARDSAHFNLAAAVEWTKSKTRA